MKDSTQLSIYDYLDYRAFLRDYYEMQKKRTKFFSYRYFAQKAGFSSHNVLKQVIEGQRNIAGKSIPKFTKALNLTIRESDYFKLLVLFCQSKSEAEKNDLFKELFRYQEGSKAKLLNELQYKMYSEWYYAVIRELITIMDVEKDHSAVGKSLLLDIGTKEVKASLKLLSELGLIQKNEQGKWVQCNPIIKTEPELHSFFVRNYNRKMIELSALAIDLIPQEKREMSSITLGISKKAYRDIKKKIQDFKDKILSDVVSDSSESEEVYQLNFQFFPLLKNN